MRTFFLLILFFATKLIFAQESGIIKNEVIVRLKQSYQINQILERLNSNSERKITFELKRVIDSESKYYTFKINQNIENIDETLYRIRSIDGIDEASFNHRAVPRKTPNDSLFSRQWNLTKIQLPAVWDSITGGKTFCGDEIVVAVCEPGYGFMLNHEDIRENIWINKDEIQNDGIDNDQNGVIDDINGIDANNENGKVANDPQRHGTSVLSIIGAKTNNTSGVAGINWNVKMLLVSNLSTQDDAIFGYNYIIKMRDLYNKTNGAKGAYIVVTNFSGGIDNVFGTDIPLWCDMFNKMQKVGILSTVSGPNANVDIDKVGDAPSTCTSSSIIAVTNSNRNDIKVTNAGFGQKNIDLAAPGGIYSTSTQVQGTWAAESDSKSTRKYQEFSGTSAAAPHVAGAIALLYSIKDSTLCKNSKLKPEETAIFLKDILLRNVDTLGAFKGNTVSGGRLNVLKSYNALKNALKPSNVSELNLYPNPSRQEITLEIPSLKVTNQTYYLYNEFGKLINTIEYTTIPLSLNKLRIDISNLTHGVYFISTRNEEGKFLSKKFIKI